MTPPPPTLAEVIELALKFIGGLAAVGVPALKVMSEYNKRQQEKEHERQSQQDGNFVEAGRLRDELRVAKEAAERRADECEAEAERYKSAYYRLRSAAGDMIGRCRQVVRAVMVLLRGAQHEPAKEELAQLHKDLNEFKLPDPPD